MFVDLCIIVQFIKKNPTKCNNVSTFYYSIFIWSSRCFGRHTAHHQEPKTALAASGFSYLEGCWTCSWWTLSGTYCAWQRPPTTRPTTFQMMAGVSPETCWAPYKYGIIKFWYIVASFWIFLYECCPCFQNFVCNLICCHCLISIIMCSVKVHWVFTKYGQISDVSTLM